jgi:hypothetical protein
MASEAPRDQGKPPEEILLGLLLGMLVGSVVVWVTLNDVLESESVLQSSYLRQMAYGIGVLVGGGIGGIIQLWKQGRTAAITRFLRWLLGSALLVIFFFGSMYLGAWLGDSLFGRVGYVIGWLTGAVLFFVVQSRFPRLSSCEQSSAPPPA